MFGSVAKVWQVSYVRCKFQPCFGALCKKKKPDANCADNHSCPTCGPVSPFRNAGSRGLPDRQNFFWEKKKKENPIRAPKENKQLEDFFSPPHHVYPEINDKIFSSACVPISKMLLIAPLGCTWREPGCRWTGVNGMVGEYKWVVFPASVAAGVLPVPVTSPVLPLNSLPSVWQSNISPNYCGYYYNDRYDGHEYYC